MPELSDQQRRRLAELEPRFASARLVDMLELKMEVTFKCLACGATKTWRRDTMLGRAKGLLGLTMAEVQKRAPCPRCGRKMPAMAPSGGVWNPQGLAAQYRAEVMEALAEAGLKPSDYGYGWRTQSPNHW